MPPFSSYRRHRFSSAVLPALLALAVCFAPSAGYAGSCRLVAVLSADLQPYQDVMEGIRHASSCSVREVTLRDDEGAGKILARSPDVVVAVGTSAMKKLASITSVPIVYAMVVPSEAARRQGPNISGVSMDVSPVRYLSEMRQVFPAARRIGVLYDPRHTAAFFEDAARAARAAGVELVARPIDGPEKAASALAAIKDRIDVYWMLPDPSLVTPENLDLLLRCSFQQNLPIFTFSRKYLEQGAVASLDFDPYDIGVQAAEMADRVRRGPGTVREYARTARLAVNGRIARKMGLTIPVDVMRRVKNSD